MTDSTQLLRQWKMLQIFSARRQGVAVKELAQEFEVSQRTILRDLSLLKSVCFPLKEKEIDHGKKLWFLDRDEMLANIKLNFEEAGALWISRQFLESLAGTPFWSNAHSAYQKIHASLGKHVLEYLEKLASAFYFNHAIKVDYALRAEMINDLCVAIEDRHVCAISYQSMKATEPVSYYDIHPYALIFYRGALYLRAYSEDHQERRTFKLDRISDVSQLELKFTKPKAYDPKADWEHSFGIFAELSEPQLVRVRFAAKVKRILEEKSFHPSQLLSTQKDGSVIADYMLSSLEEFRSWVLSFGRLAQVLEPDELVESVRNEIEAMSENYKQGEKYA